MLVTTEFRGAAAVLTLQRPEALNALSQRLVADFRFALQQIIENETLRSVIVRGSGRAFCSGSDLKELHGAAPGTAADQMHREATLCEELESFPLPTIAAIHGYALGGGLTLALSHDFRVMTETAKLGAPEVRLGWNPPFGIAQMVRILGESIARDLLLTGRLLDAQEALALGIVQRVAPDQDLESAAQACADQFADLPVEAVKACKRQVNRVARQQGGPVGDEELQQFLRCLRTPEAHEAIERFFRK